MTAQSKITKKMLTKAFVGVLLTLSVAGFIFSDFQSYYTGGSKKIIRTVNGIDITASDLTRERDGLVQRLGAFPQDAMMRQQIIDQSLDNITLRTAIFSYASQNNLRASDTETANIIQSISAFNGTDGQFDGMLFKRILHSQGISVKEFQDNIAESVVRENFTTPIASEFPLADKTIKTFNHFAFTKINFTAYHVHYDKLPYAIKKITPPSEDQLKQIYSDKKDDLIRPALKNIQFVTFNAENLHDKIRISHKQITDFYMNNQQKLYTNPEKRKVLQIVIDDEKKAFDIFKQFTQRNNFKTVAQKLGYETKDIDLGYVTKDDITDKTAQKNIFSSPRGITLAPIKTDFGYAIYYVDAISPAKIQPLNTVKSDIQKMLFQKELAQYLADIMPKIDDDLAGGADLSEITKKYGSRVMEQQNITPKGIIYTPQALIKQQPTPPILTLNPQIPLDDVNQYHVGDDIPLIMGDDNQFTILKITDFQPQRPLSFDESKELLSMQDIVTQKNTILKTVIDNLKKHKNKSIFCRQHRIIPKNYTITRNDNLPQEIYRPEFNKIIFAKNANEYLSHIDDNSAIILAVNAIMPPLNIPPAESADFMVKLQKNYDSFIQDEAISMIRNTVTIETNDDVFNQYLARELEN